MRIVGVREQRYLSDLFLSEDIELVEIRGLKRATHLYRHLQNESEREDYIIEVLVIFFSFILFK
jgi:hypothetical protein